MVDLACLPVGEAQTLHRRKRPDELIRRRRYAGLEGEDGDDGVLKLIDQVNAVLTRCFVRCKCELDIGFVPELSGRGGYLQCSHISGSIIAAIFQELFDGFILGKKVCQVGPGHHIGFALAGAVGGKVYFIKGIFLRLLVLRAFFRLSGECDGEMPFCRSVLL